MYTTQKAPLTVEGKNVPNSFTGGGPGKPAVSVVGLVFAAQQGGCGCCVYGDVVLPDATYGAHEEGGRKKKEVLTSPFPLLECLAESKRT